MIHNTTYEIFTVFFTVQTVHLHASLSACACICALCVCVCVCVREREREGGERECACVHACNMFSFPSSIQKKAVNNKHSQWQSAKHSGLQL